MHPFSKLGILKNKLLDLQKIKGDLQSLREKIIEKAHADEKVKAIVKKYWDMKSAIQSELEKQFTLKSADTGANCD